MVDAVDGLYLVAVPKAVSVVVVRWGHYITDDIPVKVVQLEEAIEVKGVSMYPK